MELESNCPLRATNWKQSVSQQFENLMPPFSFEQIANIATAFRRYEETCPGLTANLALLLGSLAKPGCILDLSGTKHLDQVEYLHMRLPQYVGTIGNRANPPHQQPVFEAFLYFDHAGDGPQRAITQNRLSIRNPVAFDAYKANMIERFDSPNRKSVPLAYLLQQSDKWVEVLDPYLANPSG